MLGNATEGITRSFERLASGQRINRASDDAAGLAVSASLKVGTRLYTTAIRNANDGLSAIGIISGTLANQTGIITRLSELAEQGANGTYSLKQRQAINKEYQALVREFGRLGDTASFNNIKLLNAGRNSSPDSLQLQVGVDGSSSSLLRIQNGDTGTLSGRISAGDFGGVSPIGGAWTDEELYQNYPAAYQTSFVDSLGRTQEAIIVLWNNRDQEDPGAGVAVLIRGSSSNGAISNSSERWVSSSDEQYIVEGSTPGKASVNQVTLAVDNLGNGASGTVMLDLRGLTFETPSTGDGDNFFINGNPPTGSSAATTALEFTGVDTQGRARAALTATRNRLDELNILKGKIGAFESRISTSLGVTSVLRENYTAADSRISDVDVAEETALLTKSSILQQVATAVLAQTNFQPQLTLSLIQNS